MARNLRVTLACCVLGAAALMGGLAYLRADRPPRLWRPDPNPPGNARGHVQSRPVSLLYDAPALLDAADTVVLGEVVGDKTVGRGLIAIGQLPDGRYGLLPAGSGPATSSGEQIETGVTVHQAAFQAVDVVKGDYCRPGALLQVEWFEADTISLTSLEPGAYGFLLLDQHGRLSDLEHSLLPVAKGVVPPPGTTGKEAVGQCMLASLKPQASGPAFFLEGCAQAVWQLQPKGATARLRDLATWQDVGLRANALVALVHLGDADALRSTVDLLLRKDWRSQFPGLAIANARGAISSLSDPASVPEIARLLSSPEASLRGQALQAMRKIGSPVAATYFAAALSDEAVANRHQAVLGLAELLWRQEQRRDLPAPGAQLFDPDPDRYTQPWRDWWEREGKAKYGQGGGK